MIHNEKEYLILNRRQTSWLIVAGLALMALAFLVGYFWGQHTALDQWIEDTQTQRFGDHIYTALYTRYDDAQADDTEAETTEEETEEQEQPILVKEPQKTYYAQLIGYKASQKKEAERFVAALKKQSVEAVLRERSSRSKRGRTIIWYQVVIGPYIDPLELQQVKAWIEKQYKLHDIKIVEESMPVA